MTDIVLNTHSLTLLYDDEIINRIVSRGDYVFVAKCTWNKELKGVFPPHLISLLYHSVKKLGNKLKVKEVRNNFLPNNLKRRLNCHKCDVEIANLAFERYERSRQRVYLVSNDPCLQKPRPLFERYGVDVKSLDEFKSVYCN